MYQDCVETTLLLVLTFSFFVMVIVITSDNGAA